MDKEKEIVELIKPFGPMILKVKLPKEIVADLNQDCLDIADNKKEKIDWSDQLAGRVEEEYHISKDLLIKHAVWFNAVTSRYLFPDEKSFIANKGQFKVGISSGWYVRSFDGDFNPQHFHTGCQISCLGYLKLPDDIDEYWKEEDKDHNPFGGYTDFRYGTIGLNCPNNMKIKPKVGEFYMFPHWLDHQVYPFRSKYKKPDIKGERRSFSLNIVYQNVKEDRNKNQSES
jgi:hypothetical protein